MEQIALFPFVVLVVSTIGLVSVGIISWRYRPRQGALWLAVLMATASIWAVGSMLSLAADTMSGNVLATRIGYLGVSLVPVAWFVLSVEYAGYEEWISSRMLGLLVVIPAVTQLLAWTNHFHELLWRIHGLITVNSFVMLELDHGPWFWVHTGYSYFLLALGTAIFLRAIVHRPRLYRRQVAMALGAIVVPWVSNAISVFGIVSLAFDPTPFLFSVSGGLLFVALFRFKLLDIAPIARDTVMDVVEDGVVVLDDRDRVVDINHKGEELLGVDADSIIGNPAGDVFYGHYVERYRGVFEKQERIAAEFPDGERFIDLRISPLYSRTGGLRGRVVILRDVTTEERQKRELQTQNRELEQQNEKLERFASIVSHDLRNPLSIAQGHLHLLADDPENEHVDRIEQAHGKMHDLIDDLLALARHGKSVGEVEPVPLQSVVETSTSLVAEATVEIEGDLGSIEADPGRLQQLFENLFRNSVEHGSAADGLETEATGERGDSGVTIWVGRLDRRAGFYVEDDGQGIPPDERETVFEFGHTDSSSGTGLGLAIVRNVVQAHGWEIGITSGRTGGARFEIVTREPVAPDGPETPPETYT